jgi:hypothetical protein
MFKKIIAIILAFVFAFSCLAVSASAFELEDAFASFSVSSDCVPIIIEVVKSLWQDSIAFFSDFIDIIKTLVGLGGKTDEPVLPPDTTEEPVEPIVEVKLIALGTTIIDRDTGIIYGLKEFLTIDEFTSKYVEVQGDGRIEIVDHVYNYIGTGATVNVYNCNGTEDVTDDELVETLRVIIFGDVTGDSVATAVDATFVYDEANGITAWSIPDSSKYDPYKVIAADLDKDNAITREDGILVGDSSCGICRINQVTGKIY